MKTTTILKTALLTSLLAQSTFAEVRIGRKMDLVMPTGTGSVEIRQTTCKQNRHGAEYTQREWDRMDTTTCYYYVIKDAYFSYNDDSTRSQHGPYTLVTRPILHQRLSAMVPDTMPRNHCISDIANSIQRSMRGEQLRESESFNMPQLEARGFDADGNIIVDSADGNVTGLRSQAFFYEDTSRPNQYHDNYGCNPQAFNQIERVRIADQMWNRVEDPDAPLIDHIDAGARNLGKGFRRLWQGTTTTTRRVLGNNE